MKSCRLGLALMIVVVAAAQAQTADPPPLLTAQGAIEKVDAGKLIVKTRGPDGKFGKNLVLQITGTTKIATLTPRMQKGRMVMAQKDTDAKELQPRQFIALVYTMVKDSPLLLAAVVQPPADK